MNEQEPTIDLVATNEVLKAEIARLKDVCLFHQSVHNDQRDIITKLRKTNKELHAEIDRRNAQQVNVKHQPKITWQEAYDARTAPADSITEQMNDLYRTTKASNNVVSYTPGGWWRAVDYSDMKFDENAVTSYTPDGCTTFENSSIIVSGSSGWVAPPVADGDPIPCEQLCDSDPNTPYCDGEISYGFDRDGKTISSKQMCSDMFMYDWKWMTQEPESPKHLCSDTVKYDSFWKWMAQEPETPLARAIDKHTGTMLKGWYRPS